MNKYFVLIGCNIYDWNYRNQHPDWKSEFVSVVPLAPVRDVAVKSITDVISRCSFYALQGTKKLEAAFLIQTNQDVRFVIERNGGWPYDHVNNYDRVSQILMEWFPGDKIANITEVLDEAARAVGHRPTSYEIEREYRLAIRLADIVSTVYFDGRRNNIEQILKELILNTLADIRHNNSNSLERYAKDSLKLEKDNIKMGPYVGVVGQGNSPALSIINSLMESASIS